MPGQFISAAAAATLIAGLASNALAQEQAPSANGSYVPDNNVPLNDPLNSKIGPGGAKFDLGIDVSNIPATPAGTHEFLATLPPDGQQIMLKTCANYLADSSQVLSAYTITFCRALLSG